jgi:stress response protein YsnF
LTEDPAVGREQTLGIGVGGHPGADAVTPPDDNEATGPAGQVAIPLAEETATLRRDTVVSGRVRVRTVVDWHEQEVETSLLTERVEVTTVPIGRVVDEPPRIRVEGDVTIVPVLEEEVVVERRLVLREEIHLRRLSEATPVTVPVALRRERAEIERSEGPPTQSDQETPP